MACPSSVTAPVRSSGGGAPANRSSPSPAPGALHSRVTGGAFAAGRGAAQPRSEAGAAAGVIEDIGDLFG